MKKLILSCSLLALTAPAYAALDCAPLPDCEDFGYAYTDDDCAGQATLKCPFDRTKLYCTEPGGKQAAAVTCIVGAVLYNDLKCYDEAPEDKTAIAVVFDTSKRLAISLSTGMKSISWGGSGTDIPELNNCAADLYKTCDRTVNGKENTAAIVAALGESSTYAAGYCNDSTYGNLAQGSWFLPKMSELETLYNNKTKVNAGLTKAGGTTIPTSGYYWSSTEYSSVYALLLTLNNGDVYFIGKSSYGSNYYARCAVQY